MNLAIIKQYTPLIASGVYAVSRMVDVALTIFLINLNPSVFAEGNPVINSMGFSNSYLLQIAAGTLLVLMGLYTSRLPSTKGKRIINKAIYTATLFSFVPIINSLFLLNLATSLGLG